MSPTTTAFLHWLSGWSSQAVATAIGGSIAAWVALTVAKMNAAAALDVQRRKEDADRKFAMEQVRRKDAGSRRQMQALLVAISPYYRSALNGYVNIKALRSRYATLRPSLLTFVAAESLDDAEAKAVGHALDTLERADAVFAMIEPDQEVTPDVPWDEKRVLQTRCTVAHNAQRPCLALREVFARYHFEDEVKLLDDAPRFDWAFAEAYGEERGFL